MDGYGLCQTQLAQEDVTLNLVMMIIISVHLCKVIICVSNIGFYTWSEKWALKNDPNPYHAVDSDEAFLK